MATVSPRDVVRTVIDVLTESYGNLGYIGFQIHSIKPNHKENVFIVRYSFVPRDGEVGKRLYYETRVNIKDKNNFETKEIKETDL